MRVRIALALLGLLALLLSACGEDNGDEEDEEVGVDEEAPEEQADPEGELEQPELPEPVDLEEGVAALVADREISDDQVDARYEAAADVPQITEQLEGEEGETVAETLRTQLISQLILEEIVAIGAQDLGVEPDEEEVAAVEQDFLEQAGGEEELDELLAAQGVSGAEAKDAVFRLEARAEAISQELTADLEEDAPDEEAEELGMDPAEAVLQEWFAAQLAETDVEVDAQYGVWDQQSGQVIPAGAGP